MKIEIEYELNKGWIYDDEGEIIGEQNYILKRRDLLVIYSLLKSKLHDTQNGFDDWLDVYDADTDGALVYEYANRKGMVVDDIHVIDLY